MLTAATVLKCLQAKYDIESRRSSVDEATLLESLKQEYLLKARELTANTDSVQLNGGVSDEEAARQALAFAAQLEQQQGGHSPSSSANGTAAMQTEPGQASDAAAAAAAAALSPPASTKTSDFRKRRLSVTAKRAAPKAVAPEGRRPSTLYRAQEIGAAPVAPLPFAETVIGTYSCHGVEPSYYEEEGFTAKINQDRGCVVFPFGDHPRQAVFAVFDGHGEHGDIISHFVMNELQSRLEKHPALQSDPGKAFKEVYVAVDRALSKSQAAESTFSGTTAVSILMREGHLWVANAGDSRAVVAQRRGVGSGPGAFVAKDLSIDQNPNSPLEQKRIEASGGFVSPPPEPGLSARVWLDREMTQIGLAMARSIGDHAVKSIGVIAGELVEAYSSCSSDCGHSSSTL
jgi:protein phosphatase PTC2/3